MPLLSIQRGAQRHANLTYYALRRPTHKTAVELQIVQGLEQRLQGQLKVHPTPCAESRHCGKRPQLVTGLCDMATLQHSAAALV